MLECVLNISEGRDDAILEALTQAAGDTLLDLHRDPHHHRSVLTLVGDESVRDVARLAVDRIDLTAHDGVHPRIGVVDVVPFVALDGSSAAEGLAARDDYARWSARELGVGCFLYGPERSLPDVRAAARAGETPDVPSPSPRPGAGFSAVGQRDLLVAYNVWLADPDVSTARRIAAEIRRPGLRTLGLQVGDRAQVSMNLVEPERIGPATAYDAVAASGGRTGAGLAGAELVGLVPRSVLDAIPTHRWAELDLSEDRTIEARLATIRPTQA